MNGDKKATTALQQQPKSDRSDDAMMCFLLGLANNEVGEIPLDHWITITLYVSNT